MRLSEETIRVCHSLIERLRLPQDFLTIIEQIYLPLSQIIIDERLPASSSAPLLVNINGAQGTGKSTLTSFLKAIIESETGEKVAELSLDDFYLTRGQRKRLSEQVHPLFMTRGVPGTHDIDLVVQVIDSLHSGRPCDIPRFDKALDERCAVSGWSRYDEAVGFILFEGWCNGSPVQSDDELAVPVNELEEKEDAGGVWRGYANQQLKQYHNKVFDHADMCIMLDAGEFERIYEWRSLQEDKLRESSENKQHVMDAEQLKRFIQHYERISRHTLRYLPERADIVLPVARDHAITGISKKAFFAAKGADSAEKNR